MNISTDRMTPDLFARLWLPKRPLASNDIHTYSHRQSRAIAMTNKWVEIAPTAAKNLLVADVDLVFAHAALQELVAAGELPEPNFTVINLESTKAHAGWFIDGAVSMSPLIDPKTARPTARHNTAVKFYRNVEERLRVAANGDKAFTKRTMRNPLVNDVNRDQITAWGTSETYSLQALNALLPQETPGRRSVASMPLFREEIALTGGRNHDTFTALRVFGYSAFHRTTDEAAFLVAMEERANEINASWLGHPSGPLDGEELGRIVSNVCDWILKHFERGYKAEDLAKIQYHRAQRRWLSTARAKELHAERMEYANPAQREVLQARLQARLAAEAFDAEIAAYLEAGEKLRHMFAALGEPRGLTYDAFARRVSRIRKKMREAHTTTEAVAA